MQWHSCETRTTPTTPPIVLGRSLPIALPPSSSTGSYSKHTTINLNEPLEEPLEVEGPLEEPLKEPLKEPLEEPEQSTNTK